jgi:hypothetical protein
MDSHSPLYALIFELVLIYFAVSINFRKLSNNTILETNTNSICGKKNITVSSKTYNRLVAIGRFSDRTFDHLIGRLLDEREGKENISGGSN